MLVDVVVSLFDAPSVVAIQLAAAAASIVLGSLTLFEYVSAVAALIAFDMTISAEMIPDLTVWFVVPEPEFVGQPHGEN